jgi:hypothetical protein
MADREGFPYLQTDLRIRPIFHRKKDRIEAHICIAFVAYSIYKELERLLKENKLDFSPAKAIWLSKTIYELEFTLPESHKTHAVLANISSDQEALLKIFEIGSMTKSGKFPEEGMPLRYRVHREISSTLPEDPRTAGIFFLSYQSDRYEANDRRHH